MSNKNTITANNDLKFCLVVEKKWKKHALLHLVIAITAGIIKIK